MLAVSERCGQWPIMATVSVFSGDADGYVGALDATSGAHCFFLRRYCGCSVFSITYTEVSLRTNRSVPFSDDRHGASGTDLVKETWRTIEIKSQCSQSNPRR